MSTLAIDAQMLKKLFLAGAATIEADKDRINELNVFPVPDGDTGTNMTLTIISAAKDVAEIEDVNFETLCKTMSSGSLRGARGNSGVILSQLLRGFTKEVKTCTEITVPVAVAAFNKAVETAYKAVMKPKEGTILTVARGGAVKASQLLGETEDLVEFLEKVVERMREVLDYTPELLPVLKEAGVVDSGGAGLLAIMEGALKALKGEDIDVSAVVGDAEEGATKKNLDSSKISTANIKYGYCTEFIVVLDEPLDTQVEEAFKNYLLGMGDSLVFVGDEEYIKIHVHTNHPGEVFEKALTYGQLSRMKIDNMRIEATEKFEEEREKIAAAQSDEKMAEAMFADIVSRNERSSSAINSGIKINEKKAEAPKKEEVKEVGFIAVSIGSGMNEIFKGLGVDYIIEGGQTMNPSTEDMLNAISNVNAKTIYILPNNGNVVLAANQAASLTKDKKIVVVPSKTVPQGIAALINYVYDRTPEENTEYMKEQMAAIKSGEVTYAVRDTTYEGKTIKQNDIMGIGDKGIAAVGSDIEETALELIASMVDEDSGLVSIYYGAERTEADAEKLSNLISEKYPDVDVDVQNGGQPIYYYVLSVE